MQFLKILIVGVLLSTGFHCEAQIRPWIKPLSIGESISFHSDILKENRRINVYLPEGYSPDSSKTYPVIYLLDGSMDEDFIHIAGLVQFGSFPWINMLPESIVVGIANTDRKRDFTFPSNNEKDLAKLPTSGGSDKFIKFIEKELQPLIEKQYKTAPQRTLIGQSLGGLLTTEILFKKPKLFDNYIIVSPSLWWDNQSLLKSEPVTSDHPTSVYISVGKEGEMMEGTAKSLYKKLKEKERIYKLYFRFFEDKNHGDALHVAVYDAFEKLFGIKD